MTLEAMHPEFGVPALHVAANVGDHDAIRRLVAGGADINEADLLRMPQIDPDGRVEVTPLMVAAASLDGASVETVRLLLGLGADVEPARTQSVNPQSMLACAATSGDVERVDAVLAAGAGVEPVGFIFEWDLPLYQAARSGSVACVRRLLDVGVPFVAEGYEVDGPVLAYAGSVDVVEYLLELGADPHEPCQYGTVVGMLASSPLPVAARVAMVRRMTDAGVDLDDPRVRFLETAVSMALFAEPTAGDLEAADVLLAAGASVHVGMPLHVACFGSSLSPNAKFERMVDLLVDAGADPNEPDDEGFLPLQVSLSPYTSEPGFPVSDGASTSTALALIRRGASIDIEWPLTGFRPLHAAASATADLVVAALLDAGADPTVETLDGRTALDVARAAADGRAEWPPRTETWAIEAAHRCVDLLEAAR